MTCLDPAEIARIVATGDVPSHVADCIECRRDLERQRAIRDALRALPIPRAATERRRAIKAETMASIGFAAKRPRRFVEAAALVVAVAAALFAFAMHRVPEAPRPVAIDVTSTESLATPFQNVAYERAPLLRIAPAISARPGAVFSQTPSRPRDVVVLADGAIDVDTRGDRGVDVHVGRTVVRVDDASVTVRAIHHTIASVEVVIGSARVFGPDQDVTLEHDTVWTEQPLAVPAALTSFRDAWVALRAGNNHEAVELFDRATDPVVAEEASYWAAVAANRAGDAADARRRLSEFIARFPGSPYVEQARRVLAGR